MFDDLIPAKGAKSRPSGGMFDDLIPTTSNGVGKLDSTAAEEAMAGPQGQELASQLRSKSDRMLTDYAGVGPGYAAVSSAANTALMNIPRNVGAAVRTMRPGAGTFDQEYAFLKDVDEAAYRQNRLASGAGMVAGAVGQAAAIPIAPAASLIGKVGQGAAIGATNAGVSEFADTKDLASAGKAALIGGAIGGVASPLVEKAVSGVTNAAGRLVQKAPQIPSKADLKAASQSAYDAADQAGLIVNRQGISNIASDIKTTLANEAYHPKNQPKLANFLGELERLQVGNAAGGVNNIGVTLRGLDTTRKMLRAARASADPEEKRMAAIATEKFDDYLQRLSPSEISAGDKGAAVKALNEARSLWSSYRKADLIDEAVANAQLAAGGSGSGGNIENAMRQALKGILKDKRKSAAFSDAEKAQMASVVTGTKGQNTLRLLGKLSPEGNGLMLAMHAIGGAATGGQSFALAGLGYGAKALADRGTRKSIEQLDKMIRARGAPIKAQDLVEEAGRERLRNFLTSVGVNVDKIAQNESD